MGAQEEGKKEIIAVLTHFPFSLIAFTSINFICSFTNKPNNFCSAAAGASLQIFTTTTMHLTTIEKNKFEYKIMICSFQQQKRNPATACIDGQATHKNRRDGKITKKWRVSEHARRAATNFASRVNSTVARRLGRTAIYPNYNAAKELAQRKRALSYASVHAAQMATLLCIYFLI
jgi:hypothetical protein